MGYNDTSRGEEKSSDLIEDIVYKLRAHISPPSAYYSTYTCDSVSTIQKTKPQHGWAVVFVEDVFIRSPIYDCATSGGVPSHCLIFAYIACAALNYGGSAAVLSFKFAVISGKRRNRLLKFFNDRKWPNSDCGVSCSIDRHSRSMFDRSALAALVQGPKREMYKC